MTQVPDSRSDEDTIEEHAETPKPRRRSWALKVLAYIGMVAGIALVLAGGYAGYLYASTPVSIREPLPEHYHFRMQVLVDGKAVNFADDAFQEGYSKDNCSALLTSSPIHFHDKKDQFVHIHWEGMTGGQVLKYYGWNFIGGINGSLGNRFDSRHRLQRVPVHGDALPAIPKDATFSIYIKNGDKFTEKKLEDFTHQDLEVFFGKTSNYPGHELNKQKRGLLDDWRDRLVPTAHAHDGETHVDATGAGAVDDPALTKLNNLLGDVVIFVQKDKPTSDQVRQRFEKLEPLSTSTCGG